MVTQSEVAKKAGVSFITVSRVINDKGNVKTETKKRVLKIIEKLGYYPNSLGRGLNMNRTFSIGIVIPFTSHIFRTPYYVELLSGVEKACAEKSYNILLYPKQEETEVIDYKRLFFERKADGLIVIAPELKDEQIKVIDEKKIPCVVVDGRQSGKNIIFIDSNNQKGSYIAVEFLIKNGHRKIGFISGWTFVRNGRDRYVGYKKALQKYNIKIKEEYIFSGDFTELSGYLNMQKMLSLPDIPTAVFAANDLMAIGAMRAIKEKKLRIPDDISIIGFDDIQILNYISPFLTTIKQFPFDMGYTSAKSLIDRIDNSSSLLRSKIFNVELMIRESVRKL